MSLIDAEKEIEAILRGVISGLKAFSLIKQTGKNWMQSKAICPQSLGQPLQGFTHYRDIKNWDKLQRNRHENLVNASNSQSLRAYWICGCDGSLNSGHIKRQHGLIPLWTKVSFRGYRHYSGSPRKHYQLCFHKQHIFLLLKNLIS